MSGPDNLRDLADVPLPAGRQIKPERVFRSAALTGDPSIAVRLSAVALVCDLRSAGERQRGSTPLAWPAAVTVVHRDVLASIPDGAGPWPVLTADPSARGAHAAMIALYRAMPAAAGSHMAAIMHDVAAGRLPLLIHCTAGKDRTGFVAAALLAALGAAPSAILADYMMSAGPRGPAATAATRQLVEERLGRSVDDATIAVMMGVSPEFLSTSLAVIDDEFGGPEGYFARFGIDGDLLATFRGRLLV